MATPNGRRISARRICQLARIAFFCRFCFLCGNSGSAASREPITNHRGTEGTEEMQGSKTLIFGVIHSAAPFGFDSAFSVPLWFIFHKTWVHQFVSTKWHIPEL